MVIGSEILSEKQMILIGILVVIFVVFAVLVNLLDNKSLNGIKAKKIGDGQHVVLSISLDTFYSNKNYAARKI